MRQYWINFRGKQEGPLSIEKLELMGVDETAYVWHSGLDDWVKITSVPELRDMLDGKGVNSGKPADEQLNPEQEDDYDVPDLPNGINEDIEEPPVVPQHEDVNDNQDYNLKTAVGDTRSYGYTSQAQSGMEETPKCPPTNMVWSIILVFLCCTPAAIVGIIYAYLTKKAYRNGDYKKAERYSEYGAWACILSIVLGLMSLPLSFFLLSAQ